MDTGFWFFFGLGWLACLLLTQGLYTLWTQRARGSDRLSAARTRPASEATGWDWLRISPQTEQWLQQWPGLERHELFLQQTGWPITVAQSLTASAALAVAAAWLGMAVGGGLAVAALCAIAAPAALQGLLLWRRNHRGQLIERQLPDALDLVARSMQAGHAFTSALQMAARESPSPIGQDLRNVFSTIQYGATAQDALAQWARRVQANDVRIFVTGVRIQTETGGNLAELLHQTAGLVRERQKLRGTIRVLSAEGRISALILTLLPFVLAGMLTALNPQFMARLWHEPLGHRLVAIAGVLMVSGVFWMWRLVQIRP